MKTECNQTEFGFQDLNQRKVVADFAGGELSSDGGGLLLREVEHRRGWVRDFARCFADYRNPVFVEHKVEEMAGQRIFGLALGCEDLNDHDLRQFGLTGTKMAQATCGTIRLRLLKIGALILVSVRRVLIHLASSCACQEIFGTVFKNLQRLPMGSS